MRKAVEVKPDILGLSGLLTVATDGMKATIDAVRDAGGEIGSVPIIIGGGIVGRADLLLDRRRPLGRRRLARRPAHPRGHRRGTRLTSASDGPRPERQSTA